jgi:hypothetical protein
MSSDNGGKYYSNSERSKVLKLSQFDNMLITSNSCANNSSPIRFSNPQAHSSPIKEKESKNLFFLQPCDSFEAYKTLKKEPLNINETSRNLHKSINILSTKSSPVARSMHNISNKENTNDYMDSLNSHHNTIFLPNQAENFEIQLHDQDSSNKNKIKDSETFNAETKVVSDNSKVPYDITTLNEHTKYNYRFLNKTDSSDIFQMGLNFKLFPKYIKRYLNSLELDFLQLMNDRNAVVALDKPNKPKIRGLKIVDDIIKNIKNILKLNMNNNIEIKTSINKPLAVQFLTVDFNAINVLNRKLEGVYRRMKSVGLTINDKTKENQSIHEKSATNLSAQYYNDHLELSHSNRFLTDLKPLKPIGTVDNIPPTENKLFDLSQRIREINRSISLSPPTKESNAVSNKINTPSQEKSLENYSLNNLVDLQDKEITIPDINLQGTEFLPDTSTPVNNSYSNNTHMKIDNGDQEEKTENKYFLRTCPKSTDHFIAPLRPTPVKKKSSRVKTNCNADLFVTKGTGKKKVVFQYKVHSMFKANSNELIKKLIPESIDCENNNKHKEISVDISNVIPKQNYKPCRCGIFPSQVPPSWNNSLHKDIHQNLHKIKFKSQTVIDVINKINDNGFLYDIINVTTNSNNDKHINSTLNNINQFINLELNNSTKTIKNLKNHSIFMAVNPNSEIIGYLEIEPIKNACIFKNNELSENLINVKFGVLKLWVMIKYRNNGVASNLLKQFCYGKNLSINDVAFAYHSGQGISFIKNYFKNNSVLIY